jgi:hypothetical protein
LLALCGIGFSCSEGCTKVRTAHSRGEDLFVGREPLTGTIRGHKTGLPPEVIRCTNCHGANSQGGTDALPGQRSINRSWLLEATERRGGPPSVYDVRAFCKLLRTGVDPAYILIARDMPVYDLDDTACQGLWEFLTKEVTRNAKH